MRDTQAESVFRSRWVFYALVLQVSDEFAWFDFSGGEKGGEVTDGRKYTKRVEISTRISMTSLTSRSAWRIDSRGRLGMVGVSGYRSRFWCIGRSCFRCGEAGRWA